MASKMNCPTTHVHDLFNSLTQAARLQGSHIDAHTPGGSNTLPDVSRGIASQATLPGPVRQWPDANNGGNHLLSSQPLSHPSTQSVHNMLPPHLQPFTSEPPRQTGFQSQLLGCNSDDFSNFGFSSAPLGSLRGSLSGGLGAGSGNLAGFGSGNLGGSLGDALGRGHTFNHSSSFNDNLQCIDLGLGQM
jgi:hypothetical protein